MWVFLISAQFKKCFGVGTSGKNEAAVCVLQMQGLWCVIRQTDMDHAQGLEPMCNAGFCGLDSWSQKDPDAISINLDESGMFN